MQVPFVLLLAHAYVAVRLGGTWLSVAGLALIYVLILVGFITRRRAGRPFIDVLGWAGFLALGLFSWLFVGTVLRDLVLLVALGLAWLWAAAPAWHEMLADWSATAVWLLGLTALAVGLFNARRAPRVVEVPIHMEGLPPGTPPLRIVQITDLHVGPTIKRAFVSAVVDRVNGLQPDVVVLTGDLVDGEVGSLAPHVEPLSRLSAALGVFGITGNHEYYSGAAPWVAHFRSLGIDMLMNEHRVLPHGGACIVLAGVTDFGAHLFDADHASDPFAAVRDAPPKAQAPRVLLAHQPRSAVLARDAGFDLQLSGHTHGGQFWPWNLLVPLQQPFVAGLHRLEGMQIYVSRGTGYWGPPMRLGAPSEITVLRLQP